MANILHTRQWFLDTPIPYSNLFVLGAPNPILWDSNVRIMQIEFMNYLSQGDRCVLMDKNQNTIWFATGAADLSPVRLGDIGWVDGLVLDTMDNPASVTGEGAGSICVIYIR